MRRCKLELKLLKLRCDQTILQWSTFSIIDQTSHGGQNNHTHLMRIDIWLIFLYTFFKAVSLLIAKTLWSQFAFPLCVCCSWLHPSGPQRSRDQALPTGKEQQCVEFTAAQSTVIMDTSHQDGDVRAARDCGIRLMRGVVACRGQRVRIKPSPHWQFQQTGGLEDKSQHGSHSHWACASSAQLWHHPRAAVSKRKQKHRCV